jgi:hypothetical protein
VALYEVANLFGTLVAETILASVHVRAHQQAGHMDASDLIEALQNTLRGGSCPHMGNADYILVFWRHAASGIALPELRERAKAHAAAPPAKKPRQGLFARLARSGR